MTIHSFAGIGLGIESADELAKKVKTNKKASARWLRTKVLIIDESESYVSFSLTEIYLIRHSFHGGSGSF